MKKKLYVGCGLTGTPEVFRESVEALKLSLSEDWEVMKFLGLTDGNEADVYRKDIIENVKNCDAFLAIADHPSTGLGWELGVADARKIPTLIVIHKDNLAKLTRLVKGAADVNDYITLSTYESVSDIRSLVQETLGSE